MKNGKVVYYADCFYIPFLVPRFSLTVKRSSFTVNRSFTFRGYALERLVHLHESARHVETAFPFATLEGEQHLALAVEVAKPFWVFGVHEVAPYIVVYALKPCQALGVTGELVTLNHGNEGLDVYPP